MSINPNLNAKYDGAIDRIEHLTAERNRLRSALRYALEALDIVAQQVPDHLWTDTCESVTEAAKDIARTQGVEL